MLKLFRLLIILIVIYIGVFFLMKFLKSSGDFDYQIEGEIVFNINEDGLFYNDSEDNYRFEVVALETFIFEVNHEFNKENSIIKDIIYYKDDTHECILPIFKDELILIDMMCSDSSVINYYHNIKGINNSLDEFIKPYGLEQFEDKSEPINIEGISVYKDNLIVNHFIEFNNYKGIYNVSKNFNTTVYDVSLFEKDIYNHKISLFYENYYIVADYDDDFGFNIFYVFDFVNLKTTKIISNDTISYDSYIQGVVDSKIYLFDKDEKIQYEIDIENKKINQVGSLIKYYNLKWETMTVNQALEELKFNVTETYSSDGFVKVDKIKNNYYLFKKNGNLYEVYKNFNDNLIFLFTTNDIDNIYYIDSYIYYLDGNIIKYYNEETGNRNVLKYNEFEYNDNLKIYIYKR